MGRYVTGTFAAATFAALIVCLVVALYSFARAVWESWTPRISWRDVAEQYAKRYTSERR